MTRVRTIVLAAILAIGATGCVTMNVSSHLDPSVDFRTFRTWDWGQADALPTGDPRLDNNPFFNDYLQGAVEKALARHGLMRAASGATPDLRVHYHASINQRFQVNEPVNCAPGDCRAGVIDYEQGTLVIDVLDTATNKVVWRGWAQDSVQGVIDNQQRMEREIDEAVSKMMARFPGSL
jgi:hypothetical protein